jgi:hypothetical protein
MSDTRSLLARISAFRQRLASLPRLVADPVPNEAPDPDHGPDDRLRARVRAGSRTQAALEQSVRTLSEAPPEPAVPTHLTARARRVLAEAHELIGYMKALADDPLLAGPPPGRGDEADPLALYYRETAALMGPAVRLAQGMPDTPSVQLRLAEGLEGIIAAVRQRLAALGHALALRRRDAEQVYTLARLFVHLSADESPVGPEAVAALAAEVYAEGPAVPMRFLDAPPDAAQLFLGGPEFPAPALFAACHGLTAARVMSRMLRMAPEWADRPLDAVAAALLHDLGTMRVPLDSLTPAGELTDEQRRAVEAHPRAGAELIAYRLPTFAHLVEDIAAHHERLDGTGYPGGLKGEQVPPLTRLLAVASSYAAMCCRRPHRAAHDPRTALTDVLLYAEQNLLDRFAAEKLLALSFYPVGSVVEMTDGAVGVVAANHQGRRELHLAARPVLSLLIDAGGRLLPVPLPLDLAECEGGAVVRTLPVAERARRLGRHYPEWAA